MGSKMTVAFALMAALAATRASAEEPAIKIGLLEDQSGILAQGGAPKVHGAELAVNAINAKGGVLGRKLELVIYDPQSDNKRYQELTRRLIQSDKVDVVMGGLTSASREAIRAVIDRSDSLYFYNNEYEGGVCDRKVVITGGVPEQYLVVVPWMMKNVGKKVYIVNADYNFGQILGSWVKKLVAENGGEIVGEEYIPLSVSQYAQTIANIQKAQPDFVFTTMVGSNQLSYFGQAHAAGLRIPMASAINGPLLYEHKQLPSPSMANMYLGVNYMEELAGDTNADFVKMWRQQFPNEPYINQPAVDSYEGVHLYANAVAAAGTTEPEKVIQAIQTNDICTPSPEGNICLDRKTHHLEHRISIVKVNEDHSVSTVEDLGIIKPTWLGEQGCDLTQSPEPRQYLPEGVK